MFSSRTSWNLSPNRLAEALERVRQTGRDLTDLTLSNPTRAGFTYDGKLIRESLSQAAALEYRPEPFGLSAAREAVMNYYGSRFERRPAIEHILLTASTSEAYAYLFKLLCEPGDEVVVFPPSYPLFDYLAELNDIRLKPVQLFFDHGWHIDFHAVEQAIGSRTRAIALVHPNNPTGSFLELGDLKRLNAICSAHELALIADEVFLDYSLSGAPPFSFFSNENALTFTLSGLSKVCGLPQLKLAWIAISGPEKFVSGARARLEVIADTYLSVNTPVQLAAGVLLENSGRFQAQVLDRIRQNLSELDAQLANQSACIRLVVEGGWYVVLRLPASGSSEDFMISLIERQGVLVHAGDFFGFPGKRFVVLSLIVPPELFREGVARLLRAATRGA